MGEVAQLNRTRRFFAVEAVGERQYRAARFIGWHRDPKYPPDKIVETRAEAARRAQNAAAQLGLPVIVDRLIWRGRVVTGGAA